MEQELENVEEVQQEETTQSVDESKFESAGDDSIIKVDLSKPPVTEENEKPDEEPKKTAEDTTDTARVVASDESPEPTEKQEEIQPEAEAQEQPVLEEVTDEELEEVKEEIEEVIAEAEATGKPLPESIEKLMQFMDETGGDLSDYVKLNQDYNEMDNLTALQEYYKITKPHLDAEERAFLMDENFSFDEEVDDEKEIRKKKIALKEQVAEAKAYLDGQKSKYYEEIKAGSKLTDEQQKAVNFFNRYNKESEETQAKAKAAKSVFDKKTEGLFSNKFKGFEYEVGEKKFRFNVKDSDTVKNFIGKFLNEDGTIGDAKGYHKALYSAMNADAVAKHFYEQGKADALKNSVAKAKNVDMKPNQVHKNVDTGGLKFKVLGESSNDFKFKIRKKK